MFSNYKYTESEGEKQTIVTSGLKASKNHHKNGLRLWLRPDTWPDTRPEAWSRKPIPKPQAYPELTGS